MWLMTQHGFFSIVRNDADRYYVRARVKADLENLNRLMGWDGEVLEWPSADYRYRLVVSRPDMLALLAAIGEAVDYGNFKGRIGELPGQREKLAAYHEVWALMNRFQTPG